MYAAALPRRIIRIGTVILLGFGVTVTLLQWQGHSNYHPRNWKSGDTIPLRIEATHVPPELDIPSYCGVLNLEDISFVIKTGATEAQLKLPPQLTTAMKCVQDPLLFSDMDQTVGPYQIHDVLSRISPSATVDNPDFDIYREQQVLQAQGREADIPHLLSNAPVPGGENWRTRGRTAGWVLDKYKFLHMIERAWEFQPGRQWYVFLEADTYLSLGNLERFLASFDPEEKLYLGSAVRMWEHPTTLYFAHGGSGFALSGALVREFAVVRKGIAGRYDKSLRRMWYGDYALAVVLQENLGVKMTNVRPFMQGGSPSELAFGDSIWCQPVGTLHHMTADDFEAIYEYERSKNFEGMLFRDVCTRMFPEGFPEGELDWDNGSDDQDTELAIPPVSDGDTMPDETSANRGTPSGSFEACERECAIEADCLQFSYHAFEDESKNECHLSMIFRSGQKTGQDDAESGRSISSGWMTARIAIWVGQHSDCPV